jgi:hypothetical protein
VSDKSFLSAVVEILEKPQKVLGNRFLGDGVEHRSNLTADVGLERG